MSTQSVFNSFLDSVAPVDDPSTWTDAQPLFESFLDAVAPIPETIPPQPQPTRVTEPAKKVPKTKIKINQPQTKNRNEDLYKVGYLMVYLFQFIIITIFIPGYLQGTVEKGGTRTQISTETSEADHAPSSID